MATVFIVPDKLSAANRYGNLLPNSAERAYAFSYINWLRGGAEGLEPERGKRLSRARAMQIQAHIDNLKLWEGAKV